MLALSEPLRTAKHSAGHSMTLPPLNAPVPSLGREQASWRLPSKLASALGRFTALRLS